MRKDYTSKMDYFKSAEMNGKFHLFSLLMAQELGATIGFGKGYPPQGIEYYITNKADGKEIENLGLIICDYLPNKMPLEIFY
ncbi:hypothetical protein [Echinicola pacifica]|nr:hypothetical protein [Echinicola pacifica]